MRGRVADIAFVIAWVVAYALFYLLLGALVTAGAAVPEHCRQYQRAITAQAHNTFGLDAPVSTLAAQVQQESGCNPTARSPYAAGLTQFTPVTAADMAKRYPTQLGPADPLNPGWAIAAQALYMRDLTRAAPGRTECDTWAFGLSAYNGGLSWLQRDQRAARAGRVAPDVWFGNVEMAPDTRRAAWAIRENRDYPRRILLSLTPIYMAGGYGRGVACEVRP